MVHIELSGFGINCKSTIAKALWKDGANKSVLPVMSDSSIIADMYTRYWASFDPEERCRFRFHQIESMYKTFGQTHHLIIDRGIVDQICFARLIDKGFIKRTIWIEEGFGEVNENYSFIDDYIPYEMKFPFKRVFIMTLHKGLIHTVLTDEKEASVENRSYFSKSVDDYLRLQEAFYNEYKSIVPDHQVLVIEENSLEKSLKTITQTLKEALV